MSHRIGIGLIGCGQVAETWHLPALKSLKIADVKAVADVHEERVNKVADQFDVSGRYSDYGALLNDPSVDVVGVCVPPHLHVEVALAVLRAGKHALIEKPLALTLEECDRLMVVAAGLPSLKVAVGFNLRWHRLVRQARDILSQGSLGDIHLVRSTFASNVGRLGAGDDWKWSLELGGSVLCEQATHHFDLWRFLLRSDVEEIFAMMPSGSQTAAVMARLEDGTPVSASFARCTSNNNELEIFGQNASLRLCSYRFDGLEILPASSGPGAFDVRLKDAIRMLQNIPWALRSLRQGGDTDESYRFEWQHLIQAIREDKPVEECTLSDGRRAVQVMSAALASVSAGQPVKINDVSQPDNQGGLYE